MANWLKSLGWWVLGALFLLAPLGGEAVHWAVETPASLATRATFAGTSQQTAPEARWMGSVDFEFQSAGEALSSTSSYRDLTFHLDTDGQIEVVAFAFDQPLRYRIFNAANVETGVVEVAAHSEQTVQTTGSAGRENRIRVERIASNHRAVFRVRVRRIS